MKAFLIGILTLILVVACAYVGLKYFYTPTRGGQSYQTSMVTKRGELQKTNITGSDFTHVLIASGTSTGVASFTLNLNDYIGKQVEVTGQYSGNTLYADTITIIQ